MTATTPGPRPHAEPQTHLDARFSGPDAVPTPWAEARAALAAAQTYWLSTVRADGRPHVTTLLAVWHDDALHFCTGADEQKARNLAGNARCALTTGCNRFDEGLDLVVEGSAERVTDEHALRALAAAYVAKYGPDWRFDVRDGAFRHSGDEAPGGPVPVYRVAPVTAFGFAKGTPGQTRWRFTG
ncbi:pyridoxamine 5'-phosphate oxidase family protein [Streptomyces sp. Z26]|uniref:pyridoxamine 5'-phosphate oxidase family protein n=1 Tax=Streptomyces sp. Z26 TaxID=2500177 RepID=UPI000EF144D2|nr:pyridoxamine 5'-phosphate oxidase family protein [Streptomyces sp. Z26]RLL65687.1 pyridoxamine 5'-phosphate oxidase family protein [Streptomyces sp. Z26]